jgi:DNA-binding protein H-NS
MKTYAKIRAQIEALEEEAERIRVAERDGVMTRIQDAMKVYGITPEELATPVDAKVTSAMTGRKPKRNRKRNVNGGYSTQGKHPVKYTDGKGNGWSGRGTRPKWYLEHITKGGTPEDLLIENQKSHA